jgi:hypothetical protein
VETTHLIDSVIAGNFANNSGGIDNTGGSVTVLRSTIANNFAATGPVIPPAPPATATPELGSGELLVTGLLPLGLVLLTRKRRARRMTQHGS